MVIGPAWVVVTIGGGFAALGISLMILTFLAREGGDAFSWRAVIATFLGFVLVAWALAALVALLGLSG